MSAAQHQTTVSWLNRKEAAVYLSQCGFPIAAGTLARLASRRKGPPYRRFGTRTVRYDEVKLLAWARRNTTDGGEDYQEAAELAVARGRR
jgi:hypothetical protein